MKGVNFEGSLMAGANLRVATLKNSNLKNCNLRGAVLAGTDLQVCMVSVTITDLHRPSSCLTSVL